MPQTWRSEPSEDETCPHCGAVYSVVATRLPARDSDKFICTRCRGLVRAWNDTLSWSFTLKSPGRWEGSGNGPPTTAR